MLRDHRWLKLCCALLISLSALLIMGAGTASAHARVISATPAIGSTISQAPTRVSVTTAENMNPDPHKSNLFVYGPEGELISQGNATIPLNNPREMSVAIKPDGNGVYIVRWITVSAEDGDPDEGAFFFKVQPAAAAQPKAAPSSSQTTQATSPVANTTSQGLLVLWIAIAALAGLLVGGGTGLAIGRSRSRGPALAKTRRELLQAEERDTAPRG